MRIPCVYMRGGTSKGIIFEKRDLPEDKKLWDHIFLKVMGGPDPKQIDGLGGTVSSNNKILIVSPSEKADVDIEYLVAQVVVGEPIVDYSAKSVIDISNVFVFIHCSDIGIRGDELPSRERVS